jgi:hypothetical protein
MKRSDGLQFKLNAISHMWITSTFCITEVAPRDGTETFRKAGNTMESRSAHSRLADDLTQQHRGVCRCACGPYQKLPREAIPSSAWLPISAEPR